MRYSGFSNSVWISFNIVIVSYDATSERYCIVFMFDILLMGWMCLIICKDVVYIIMNMNIN